MKNKFIRLMLLVSSVGYFGQVGINTATPTSTLKVNGSLATSYSESNSTNYTIGATQHVISCTNTGSTPPVWTLPVLGTGAENIWGREYFIRNVSGNTLTLKGNGSELIDVAGTGSNTVTIPNGYTGFVKSTGVTSSAGTTWAFSIIGTPGGTLLSLQYAKAIVSPINASTPTNSVVTIGNLRVRFNATNANNSGFIEFQPLVNNNTSVLYHKGGSGATNVEVWGTNAAVTGTWYRMPGSDNSPNLCQSCRDIGYAHIILHNTKEVYRVTVNANGNIGASGSVPAVASSATLFVEKLD
ncbi:hypothetical protein [Chryseobacterium sp. JM1]|uniref:hypothetical protein n=1 Tax=Chryseobacterium sp. JM1 TaxID=1233950 RepID=UPI000AAF1C5E|nr:hypothetical protein [Chryseobacterium sp. JM1]